MSRLLVIAVLLIAPVAAGCGGSSSSGGGGSAVALKPGEAIGMKSLRFRPDHVRVPVGREITWRNDEGVGHDVVAQSGAQFESKTFGKNGTFQFTPAKAGTIKYECTLHPGMTGTIDVTGK
jgi:plastocyanin